MSMKKEKRSIIKFSEAISLLSSLLIGIISYIPYNRTQMMTLSNYINLSKSFNLVNCGLAEYFHHFVNACLSVLLIYSNDLKDERDIEDYNVTVQTNISSIFLILSYYYKHKIIKILFVISFIYYRIRHSYCYFRGMPGIKNLCEGHPLISDLYCIYTLNFSNLVLCILNCYWTILIFGKILGKNNSLLLLKNSSSILFFLPILFKQSDFNYYEMSNISLGISSLMYHINQNNQIPNRIFYYIDSFCIINTCLSRVFNPKICLMLSVLSFRSWKIKKGIYLGSYLFTFYDCNMTDKFYLLVIFGLNYLAFKNYLNKKQWTIYNRWVWHFGNSIYILIGGKYKRQLIE